MSDDTQDVFKTGGLTDLQAYIQNVDWRLKTHTHDGLGSTDAAQTFTTNNQFINNITNKVTPHVDRALQAVVVGFTSNVSTGDGQFYIHVDDRIAGMNLVDVHALVIVAGVTNNNTIQINNFTHSVDMLLTPITIDNGQTGSDTSSTPAVIDAANARVVLNDILRIDVDSVSNTPPQGLVVTLGFATP